MNDRTNAAIAAAMLLGLCAGCASTPEQDSQYREERMYRTGSNIPVKDYGDANIEVVKPDAANPIIRPGSSVVGKKPAG